MKNVMLIARREWLELGRQPSMIAIMASLFTIIAGLVVSALLLLNHIAAEPRLTADFTYWLPAVGIEGEAAVAALAAGVVGISNWLVFTQFLGVAAVLAGHSVLHDRQCQTLPFLLLAPVRRFELMAGKVIGALGPPFALYLLISGGASVFVATLPITAPLSDRLPPSPSWMIAFLIGGPLWALFVGTLCAMVSSVARDVRTAQQGVGFVVFFTTFGCGYLLAALVEYGAVVQLAVAGLGGLCGAAALFASSQLVSRDLAR